MVSITLTKTRDCQLNVNQASKNGQKGKGNFVTSYFLVKIPSLVVVFHPRTYPTESHLLSSRAPAAFAYDQSVARGRKLDAAKVLILSYVRVLGPFLSCLCCFSHFSRLFLLKYSHAHSLCLGCILASGLSSNYHDHDFH